MAQGSLDFSPPLPQPREKKAGHVRATSKSQVEILEAAGYLDARSREVLDSLRRYMIQREQAPTRAELTAWMYGVDPGEDVWTHRLLYVQRAGADLVKAGAIEAGEKRLCRITGRTLLTWRIVPAGGSR